MVSPTVASLAADLAALQALVGALAARVAVLEPLVAQNTQARLAASDVIVGANRSRA